MSKTIKLENAVYAGLDEARGKRETFSDAVAKLLLVAKITQRALHAPPLSDLSADDARAVYAEQTLKVA